MSLPNGSVGEQSCENIIRYFLIGKSRLIIRTRERTQRIDGESVPNANCGTASSVADQMVARVSDPKD